MAIAGLQPLPIKVSSKDALAILGLLSTVGGKVGRLDEKFRHSIVSDSLVQILSLSESVESTRIERTQVTFTDMVEEKDDRNPRWEVIEVANYQRALMEGAELIGSGYPISTKLILSLHKTLMRDARGSSQASGEFRKVQNFIGPTKRIEDASCIPVPANEIGRYMSNLENFINGHPYGERLPLEHLGETGEEWLVFDENAHPLVKTAILHAQFESIHPFLDGNGRLGRIMVVLHLMQSGTMAKPIFFVSEELEKEKMRYYDLLNGVRGDDPDWGSWIIFFLKACDRMADAINEKLDAAEELARAGLRECETASDRRVWIYSFSNVVATASAVAKDLKMAPNTARSSLKNLVEKGLLYTDRQTKRNKKYRNYDLLRILSK